MEKKIDRGPGQLIHMNPEFWKEFKMLCVKRGVTLSEGVSQLISKELLEESKKKEIDKV